MSIQNQIPNPFEQLNAKLEQIFIKLDELAEGRNESTMLSFREACEFLKLSKQTLYGRVSTKTIPFHKRGNRLWFDRIELVDWLKGEGAE